MKRFCSFALIGALLIGLFGCAKPAPQTQTLGVQQTAASGGKAPTAPADFYEAQAAFSLALLQNTAPGTRLISPYSVAEALGLAMTGAAGETRAALERLWGGIGAEEIAANLQRWTAALTGDQLQNANSIWIREDPAFTVEQRFLDLNAQYFGAAAYTADFNRDAVTRINEWVKKQTKDRIPQMLDELDPSAMMVLANALALDAKWEDPYVETDVRPAMFRTADGTGTQVQMMYGSEYGYLADEHATGFSKQYEGKKLRFVALLPEEGLSLDDYIASLTGARLRALLTAEQHTEVTTGLPKFEASFSAQLKNALVKMGAENPFLMDEADFSALGRHPDGNLFIGSVTHKTFIRVNETGTEAAAATTVEILCGAAYNPDPIPEVILNRPFLYMIVDNETNLPIFLGTVTEL